jgi:hypothetical protein
MNELVLDDDPTSFKEAIQSDHSSQWLDAMKDEMESMSINDVWDLIEIPEGAKTIGCRWVYKTKHDSQGDIERFKARLVAKGFTQREGIDYNETFSHIPSKASFRIIMALVAHYDLELHQMDVKMAFLNGDLHENVYMAQPEGFVVEGNEHLGCRLKKSIYGLSKPQGNGTPNLIKLSRNLVSKKMKWTIEYMHSLGGAILSSWFRMSTTYSYPAAIRIC